MVDLRNVVIAGSLALMGCVKAPFMIPDETDYGRISTDCVPFDKDDNVHYASPEYGKFNCQKINYSNPVRIVFTTGKEFVALGFESPGTPYVLAFDEDLDGKLDLVSVREIEAKYFHREEYFKSLKSDPIFADMYSAEEIEDNLASSDKLFKILDPIFAMYSANEADSIAPDLGKHGKEIRKLLKLARELE